MEPVHGKSNVWRGLLAYAVVMSSAAVLMVWLFASREGSTNHVSDEYLGRVQHATVRVTGIAPCQKVLPSHKAFRCRVGEQEVILAIPLNKTAKYPVELKVGHTYDMDVILYKTFPSILTRTYGEVN
jgi:hypothetical protein